MVLRERSGKRHFRFKVKGKEVRENHWFGRCKTKQDGNPADRVELSQGIEGSWAPASARSHNEKFSAAVEKFLVAAKARYREYPSGFRRIRTSLASALEFFEKARGAHRPDQFHTRQSCRGDGQGRCHNQLCAIRPETYVRNPGRGRGGRPADTCRSSRACVHSKGQRYVHPPAGHKKAAMARYGKAIKRSHDVKSKPAATQLRVLGNSSRRRLSRY